MTTNMLHIQPCKSWTVKENVPLYLQQYFKAHRMYPIGMSSKNSYKCGTYNNAVQRLVSYWIKPILLRD